MKLKYYLRGLGIGTAVTALIMSLTAKPEELTDAQIKLKAAQLGMVEKNTLADLQEEIAVEEVALGETLSAEEPSTEEMTTEELSTEETTAEEMTTEELSTEETTAEEMTTEELSTEETTAEEMTTEELSTEETSTEEMASEAGIQAETQESTSEIPADGTDSNEGTEDIEKTGSDNVEVEDVENYIIITIERGNGSEVASRKLYEAGLVNSAIEYDKYLIANGYDRKLSIGNHEIPVDASEEEIAKILCGMK